MVQGLRIHLPMQGTWVQSLDYSRCHEANKPVFHNYGAGARASKPHNRRTTAVRSPHTSVKSSPLTAARERLRAATKTQHDQKTQKVHASLLLAGLLTTAKSRKHSKGPSTEKWIKMWYTYH